MKHRFHLIANLAVLLALALSACAPNGAAQPTVEHGNRPGNPTYSQLIWDCNTGQALPADYSTSGPIQPGEGCDSWQINRYERPFNPQTQDTFHPDLDILSAELGSGDGWFYFRLAVFDQDPEAAGLTGSYAIEIDLDMDGRGDVLAVASAPAEDAERDWTVAGVQFWGDGNNDVGNNVPMAPDPPYAGNGYDTLVFDQGQGDDPDLAWVRVQPGKPAIVEIAFKTSAILYDPYFKWWAWSDQGVRNPAEVDYHDTFDHEAAGDAIAGQTYFPSQAINELDNTCSSIWGGPPNADPDLCANDPSVPPPSLEPSTTPVFDLTPTPPDYTATPTLPDVTVTPTVPDETITPTLTETPCFSPNSTQGQVTCTPTPTLSATPTVTPTVCFIYDNQGNFLPCTTPTPTVTPTNCYVPYAFAVIDCTPTPTWTPTITPTICVSTVTPTPTTTGTPTGSETPTATAITAPNKPAAQRNDVPCTPTPTITPTATVCANGASLVAMVLCTPTPTATICFVPSNTTASVQCSPTPSPTLCIVPDATGTYIQCTPTPQTAAMMVYPEQDSNCRRGPDSNTEIDATLFEGQGYTPTGRTPDNVYLLFRINGIRCWAAAFLFDIPFGPLGDVPISVLPYVNYPTPTPTPTQQKQIAPTAPAVAQCADGVDNDGDGAIDYVPPTTRIKPDPQCGSANDNDESK